MNETKIYITNNGVQKEYDLLITFKNQKTNKDYAIYTENMLDDKGKTMIYATTYEKNEEQKKYIGTGEPTTQEEWEEIVKVLNSLNVMS